jgi:hypothetical protein
MTYDDDKSRERPELWGGEYAAREASAWRGWCAVWHALYTGSRPPIDDAGAWFELLYQAHLDRVSRADAWLVERMTRGEIHEKFGREYVAWLAEGGDQRS